MTGRRPRAVAAPGGRREWLRRAGATALGLPWAAPVAGLSGGFGAGLGLAAWADAAHAAGAPVVGAGEWVHAYAAFGAPKHGPDFAQFDYVNPDAPKGGTLYLGNPDRRTSFDKYNYFTLGGVAPAGVLIFMHESLAVRGSDEPMTMYGLLAEAMLVAPDKSSITFRLNPKARFYNGDPVTAADVLYSYESLSKLAGPDWRAQFEGVAGATVLDERRIRFDLSERSTGTLFKIGTFLFVFSPKWSPGRDGQPRPFDKVLDTYPITTGAYRIDRTDSGRRIDFVRNPDYWARDLPVRRGFFNFDRVVYRYYQDRDVGTEAFKAGEFDLLRVYGARTWNRQHKGPKWDDGRIVKQLFQSGLGQGLQSFQINLRRPKFQDIRVREALGYTYDFGSRNRYGMFKRANSLFNNSDFAAQGLPSAGELALLEPFRAELPPRVFGSPFVAPNTEGDPTALRRHLLKARDLFGEAGWTPAPDGRLRNAQGEGFEFEYLSPNDGREAEWVRTLAKLGVTLKERVVDYALFSRRLQQFDFDTVTIVEPRFSLPSVPEYARLYGSKAADEPGSDNLRGVKSPCVDALLEAMNRATTLESLRDACRALDRVVMWNFWQVPDLYLGLLPTSYWNKFGLPARQPRYMTIESTFELDQSCAWPLTTWWIRDPAQR